MSKNITTSTAAALRTYGAPSFVVSGNSTWSGNEPTTGLTHTIDLPNPMVVRARVAAKQDRPPRGVPR